MNPIENRRHRPDLGGPFGPIGHALGMNSRVHPKYKTKYHVSNWAEYDRALVQRGDITLWFSPDAADSWTPGPSGKRGGQRKFSDQAIETALVLRLVFNLPLRQAEGFLRSVLSLMALDLEAPDHTTVSRRSQQVDVGLRLAATKSRPAASHDILDLRRCNCNTLKKQGISGPPHPPACIGRYVPNGSSPPSTDLRLPNPRGDLRIRGSGYSKTSPSPSRAEDPPIDHSKLDSPWHD
jgi:hypothetical protein